MKNFSVIIDNEELWISRSMAVAGFVFSVNENGLCVLANERGVGCPDFKFLWNCPCGYIDYNETLKEACSREVFEETNLKIDTKNLNLYKIDDIPTGVKQNITVSFWLFDKSLYKSGLIYAKGFEKNEVMDAKWISIDELDDYIWAFNHKFIVQSIALDNLRRYLTRKQTKRLKRIINSD